MKKVGKKKDIKTKLSPYALKLKNEVHALYQRTKDLNSTHFMREYYRRLKYRYRTVIKEEKSKAILRKIQSSDNKSKVIWQVINNRRPSKNKTSEELCIKDNNGKRIYDPLDIAGEFNDIFTRISANSTGKSKDNYMSDVNLPNRQADSFFFSPTTVKEIKEVVGSLKNSTSSGADEISAKTLKTVSDLLAEPISHLINFSFESGCFPDALKVAMVSPVFKKGDKFDPNNYRPISILPVISKVFEKTVLIRLADFLKRKEIITDNQHGFVKNRSTTSAMFSFIDDIVCNLDKGNCSAGLFFDLSKAFDSVNHSLLLDKLSHIGVRGLALEWFKSYLSERKQCVRVSSVDERGCLRRLSSSELPIENGVPQGSILGPTLFLIFINSLPLGIGSARPILYADDTSLSLSGPTVESLEQLTFVEANSTLQWFDSNQLSINSMKTQLLNFHISDRTSPTFSFYLDDTAIHPSKNTKFLGLFLDDKLKFHQHIEHVINRVSSGIFAIRTLAKMSNSDVLLSAYYGLIFPHLVYALPIWGSENNRTLFLFRLQKKAIRAIFSMTRSQSCKTVFQSSNILTFPSLYIYETLSFLKQNMSQFESPGKTQYNLRNFNNLKVPAHHTSFYQRNLRYNAVTLFNKLPQHLKKESNHLKFRKNLKFFLLNKSFYSVREFLSDSS